MNAIVEIKKKKKTTTLNDTATGIISCAALGGLGGFVFAYYNEKTYWIAILIGTFSGAIISKIAIDKLKQ